MTDSSTGPSKVLLRGLLVDDDETFSVDASSLMEERLAGHGVFIKFKQANSPEAAIAKINASPPFDLVMTDMLFPPVGRPDAPLAHHTQRGTDVMRAAKKADARVIVGFTRVKSQRFQEWRTRCRDITAGFYQRDDLIVAEEDSVAGEIASKILNASPQSRAAPGIVVPESERYSDPRSVAVICSPRGRVREVATEFLKSLGLRPLEFDRLIDLAKESNVSSPRFLKDLFKEVQVVLVLLTPDEHLSHVGRDVSGHPTSEPRFQPASRVLVRGAWRWA